MNKGISTILLSLSYLMLTGCEKRYVGILISTGFDHDKVTIKYNDQIVFDTIVTTNYSTCIAEKKAIPVEESNKIWVSLNDTIVDTISIDAEARAIIIKKKGNALILKNEKEKLGPHY